MMDRKEEKAFPEVLKETICAYKEDPAEDKFIDLLCLLWDGIEENGSVPVPAEMDWDKMTIRPSFRPREDGREALVALTVPDGERYPYFADVRLRAMVRIMLSMENCAGILFDPEEDTQMFFRKDLFICAIGAVLGILEDNEDQQDESTDTTRKMRIRRPVDEETFSRIEKKICRFRDDPDDFLALELDDDKDMLFIQTVRCGNEYHVELAFDMSDFDWEYPLILGHDMPLDDALKLLRQLCVNGMSPDDIDLVQNEFRDMGFRGTNK
jgi:hypothetical protein